MKNSATHDSRTLHEIREVLTAFEGDAASYRRFFEVLAKILPYNQVLFTSTLPRGGTQILLPGHAPESLLKSYIHGLHAHDRLTWQTILQNKPLNASDCWAGSSLLETAYYRQIMEPAALRYAAAARVNAPVLRGYPGALHLYRSATQVDFSAEEVRLLGEITKLLDEAIERQREPRRKASCGKGAIWVHPGTTRQFIFDASGQQYQLYKDPVQLDERVRSALRLQIPLRLANLNGSTISSDRIELPDSYGLVWVFRATAFKSFPALGEGSFVFFCLQPECCEWVLVRPSEFSADAEMSRLVPTLKFMHQEFARGPNLDEISAKAHLSPFHFHRRFSELFGQTPKHFLLNCQIHMTRALLLERKTPLAEIAAKCGFAHQSHFTSRFKQATGLTPTRWRRIVSDLQEGLTQD